MNKQAKNLTLGDTFKISILALIFALAVIFKWTTISAYLYWPFDSPPDISFESAVDPVKQKKLMEDFCAYAKREEIRHPGLLIKAKREAACKSI